MSEAHLAALHLPLRDAGPVANPAGGVFDRIALSGLTVRAHHGVFDFERRDGQLFACDVVLHVDARAAASGDDLTATVHYGQVADEVAAVLAGGAVDLLETLAQAVADVCLARRAVRAVDVTIHKPQAPVTPPVRDVTVSLRRLGPLVRRPGTPGPPRPARVVLGLGANLGDSRGAVGAAIEALADLPDTRVTGVSPLAVTTPVLAPGQEPQPDYVNAVASVRTLLAPLEVLAACQRIEALAGRSRSARWEPRTLDIDVVSYDDLRVSDPILTMPHPRAHARAFVLAPWLRIDPGASLPGPSGPVPVADLLARLDTGGVRLDTGGVIPEGRADP